MAIATLNWTPGGGENSDNQIVYYKTMDAVLWTLHSSVSASTDTVDISGLSNNAIYHFRITNNCGSVDSVSDTVEAIGITCPMVDIDTTFNSVTFTFTHLGGDITAYQIDLLDLSDSVIDTINVPSPGPTISDSFTSLGSGESFKIRVTSSAVGTLDTYTQECPSIPFTTD